MNKNHNENDRLQDLQVIKDMLQKVEERHLVESWSYFIWGAVIIIGGMIHFFTEYYFSFKDYDLALKVWLPVLCIGGLFEALGFIRKAAKESIPIFTKSFRYLFAAFIGIFIIFAILVITLLQLNAGHLVPVFINFFVALCFFGYALSAYPPLMFQAFVIIIAGIMLFVFNIPIPYSVLVTGAVIGGSFIWTGVQAKTSEVS
ncbi:MAG: hypothetical protein JW904_07300 [Spirochaetales bacterium]|nr:hypothetical protein [Spirochaetales bacterium]